MAFYNNYIYFFNFFFKNILLKVFISLESKCSKLHMVTGISSIEVSKKEGGKTHLYIVLSITNFLKEMHPGAIVSL